jgi:hydroxymethylbilane synthase
MNPEMIRIGSRGSKLALWQANWVKTRLEERGHAVEIEVITTTGDRIQNVPLSEAGGTKALFVKEIEDALLEGRVDIAVHSLKDMPAELPSGLTIAAVPEREDPRDVLIGRLEAGTRVGPSSLRRAAQLRAHFPGVIVEPLRGNLDTRIRRLDEGKWDGIVVAAAGVRRLGLATRIARYLTFEEMCPAIGQGALAIEAREGDDRAKVLDDPASRSGVEAEREVMRILGGGCRLPLAAHARIVRGDLYVLALVASPDGSRIIEASGTNARQVAADLIARGAGEILESVNAGA